MGDVVGGVGDVAGGDVGSSVGDGVGFLVQKHLLPPSFAALFFVRKLRFVAAKIFCLALNPSFRFFLAPPGRAVLSTLRSAILYDPNFSLSSSISSFAALVLV